jgi:hypothetical protein
VAAMIVCRIEMWPKSDESRKRELGEIRLTNIGGTMQSGNYKVELLKSAEYSKKPGTIWKRGFVTGFPRLRLGQYDLLLRALVACISRRSPAESAAAEGGEIAPAEDAMP